MTDPLKRQEGGDHYKSLGIQPVTFAMENRWDFCASSVLKYLTRWRAKNGVEDLRKARHFVDLRVAHVMTWGVTITRIDIEDYIHANGVTHVADAMALRHLATWVVGPHVLMAGIPILEHLRAILDGMIAEAGNKGIAAP